MSWWKHREKEQVARKRSKAGLTIYLMTEKCPKIFKKVQVDEKVDTCTLTMNVVLFGRFMTS